LIKYKGKTSGLLKAFKISIGLILLGIVAFLGFEFIPGFFKSGTGSPSSSKDVVDLSPDQYQIKSVNLLGLDKIIETSHFSIYFHSGNEDEARQLITICENDYPSLSKFFESTPKTEVLLTYDADEYVNVFNAAPPWAGADRYKDPKTSAGSFCPSCTKSLKNETEYIYMLRPGMKSFAHEISHRYYWSNYKNLRFNNDLTWLNEGLAVYVQNEIAKGPGGLSSTSLPNIKKFTLPESFSELNQLQQTGSTDMFYDLVGLMAYYISDRSSDPGLKKFIDDLNQTKDLDKTSQKILNMNSNQLFTGWKENVEKVAAGNPKDFLTSFRSQTQK